MTSRVQGPPVPMHKAPSDFAPALQSLIAEFWGVAEQEGRVADGESTVTFLEHLFGALAYESGRIDGVARLHGVPREQMLTLLGRAYASGKATTLEQHHRDSQGCACEASALLKKELELN